MATQLNRQVTPLLIPNLKRIVIHIGWRILALQI
jgi:hypothetical protein